MASPAPRTHARHVVALHDGHELDVLRIGGRLNLFEQGGKRIAHPGNDHGPAFDTAQPVDPLFHGRELEQFFDIEGARLADLAFDAHRPGARLQLARMGRRVALVQAEFIVVVVGRDIRQRRLLVHDAQGTCLPGQHGRLAHGRIRGPGAARPPRQAQARRGDARPRIRSRLARQTRSGVISDDWMASGLRISIMISEVGGRENARRNPWTTVRPMIFRSGRNAPIFSLRPPGASHQADRPDQEQDVPEHDDTVRPDHGDSD